MEHLEFVEKLNNLGCHFSTTNIENKTKTIEIPNMFGDSRFIEINNFNLKYTKKEILNNSTPVKDICTEAIDMDKWKHSWHNDIVPENYEKFKEIIQDKIIKRANDIDLLLTVYFQLNHEISSDVNCG